MNGQWLFSKYMIRRVPRIIIDHWQLTINLSFRAKRRISFPFPRGIPHCARNDRGTCCRDTNHCVSTVRTAFICVHLWNLCSDTVYLVHNHYPIGLKARFISALSRKGGVSMSAPCLEGWKPDIIPFLSLLAWPKSNQKVKASCSSHAFARLAGRKIR